MSSTPDTLTALIDMMLIMNSPVSQADTHFALNAALAEVRATHTDYAQPEHRLAYEMAKLQEERKLLAAKLAYALQQLDPLVAKGILDVGKGRLNEFDQRAREVSWGHEEPALTSNKH